MDETESARASSESARASSESARAARGTSGHGTSGGESTHQIPPVRDPRGAAAQIPSARASSESARASAESARASSESARAERGTSGRGAAGRGTSGLFSRIVLAVSGLIFGGFGVAFLLWPSQMALRVRIPLVTMTGTTDVRALYGGLEIGFGVFLLAASSRRAWALPGLAATLCALAGMGLARALGIALDGRPEPITWALLASEVSGAAIAAIALLLERRGARSGPMLAPGRKSQHQTPSAAASHMPDP